MNNQSSGFVVDGIEWLLRSSEFRQKREAIEAQVRAEHSEPLASATDYWQRLAVEDRIDREIARRLKAITPSPYSLWSSFSR